MSSYPNPAILAETDWLAEHIADPNLVVVDCDEFPAYMRLHIAGAIGLRTHHYLKEEGDSASGPGIGTHIMDPDRFAQTMSRHGIGNDSLVVAYDNMGGLYASRLWWTLEYFSHSNCKVLDGGFRKWFEEGLPVTMDQPHVDPGNFTASASHPEICATLGDVKAAIDDGDTVIWDVRDAGEYTGEDPRTNQRGGHIRAARSSACKCASSKNAHSMSSADTDHAAANATAAAHIQPTMISRSERRRHTSG